MENSYISNVVVAGDVIVDWLQYKSPSTSNISQEYKLHKENGGALHLANMIKKAINGEIVDKKVITYEENPDNNLILSDYTIHSIVNLDTYQSEDKIVYRVQKVIGDFCPLCSNKSKPLILNGDDIDAKYIILNDQGYGFCDSSNKNEYWPKAITDENKKPLIILKMSNKLKGDKETDKAARDLCEYLIHEHNSNLIVVVNAKDLRGDNVKISRHLSWEKTAEEFMWQITHNPNLNHLSKCTNLIIRFELEGVIHYKYNRNSPTAKLYYFPIYAEDDIKDFDNSNMIGITSVFIAALFSKLYGKNLDIEETFEASLSEGIHAGIYKSMEAFYNGFGDQALVEDESPSYNNLECIFKKTSREQPPLFCIEIPPVDEDMYGEGTHWRIIDDCINGKLEKICFDLVKSKVEVAMKDVPVAKFGELITVDRNEIEGYRSIKHLMNDYIKNNKIRVPLSIAVFGPPGSGKSFGVEQLANVIDTDNKISTLKYNVAQFTSIEDLTNAFHKIRDVVLDGKIPLVFFDEFDAEFKGNKLGWLKYFLAPMQDGLFKGGETMHPIGKSIFVFAGGTSSTFEIFSNEYVENKLKDRKRKLRYAKDKMEQQKRRLNSKLKKADYLNVKIQDLERAVIQIENKIGVCLLDENEKYERDIQKINKYIKSISKCIRRLNDDIPKLQHEVVVSNNNIQKLESVISKLDDEILNFRNAKGTDFVSRLRGYVNVLGPNRMGKKDELYMIRRALLLRSLLKKNVEKIFDNKEEVKIAEGVLRAFLMVPHYKHGSRSMEAIIRMSLLGDKKQYEPAVLPSAQQMELHVNSTIFSNLMLNGVLFNACKKNLNEYSYYNNQATLIIEDFWKIGLGVMPVVERTNDTFKLNGYQIENLSKMEYERREKMQSNSLNSWKKVDKKEKAYYHGLIEEIPWYLREAQFEVYPLE